MRRLLACAALLLAYGCASVPPAAQVPRNLNGLASWYGQEFAGRTTANGEIFDPELLTAAHRTLPFGTVLDVTNAKTGQTVRVRINDRGPYVGNRMIDLSYAAAQRIGLIEPGIGEVRAVVVKLGLGDREPPAPFDVVVGQRNERVTTTAVSEAPNVEFPLPVPASAAAGDPAAAEVTRIDVVEERGGMETRRQVGSDGRTIEAVPIGKAATADVPAAPGHARSEEYDRAKSAPVPPRSQAGGFTVQAGAFSVEENAQLLVRQIRRLGLTAWVEHTDLFRVKLGPYGTREQAVRARASLEAGGMSAIVTEED